MFKFFLFVVLLVSSHIPEPKWWRYFLQQLSSTIQVDVQLLLGIKLRLLLPELLLIVGVDTAQWVLHTFRETLEYHSDKHVKNHHTDKNYEQQEHRHCKNIPALLSLEPHPFQLLVVLLEAHLLATDKVTGQRVQLLLIQPRVLQVTHDTVPGFAWTAPHQQHHGQTELLEVGVEVQLPHQPRLAEQVDAQGSEDELAEDYQQCDVS